MGLIHYENGFDDLIKDIAVVDFYATWCGPCKMFGPVFEEVSKESNINFVKVDVDKENDIARRYGVMTIPTVILFKNGTWVSMPRAGPCGVPSIGRWPKESSPRTLQRRAKRPVRPPRWGITSLRRFNPVIPNCRQTVFSRSAFFGCRNDTFIFVAAFYRTACESILFSSDFYVPLSLQEQ